MYTITLTDGTTINNLTVNGNHFISSTPLERSNFSRNLDRVTITSDNLPDFSAMNTENPEDMQDWFKYDDPSMQGEFHNMKLMLFEPYESGTWFVLREQTKEEVLLASLRADMDYLLMMEEGA